MRIPLGLHSVGLLLVAAILFPAPRCMAQTPAPAADDYSGMYSFLKDGEFIQIAIEDKGAVSGFISRFDDSGADPAAFLNQFLRSGKSEGSKLSFTTENIHGVWFSFEGSFDRGPGKKPDEEAYYLLRGALTRFSIDADKKTTTQVTQVEFQSFPRDAAPTQ